jgi:hypothetical protein
MKNISKILAVLIGIYLIANLAGVTFAETMNYGDELKGMTDATGTVAFEDLSGSHWAYQFISDMVNKKILSGYPDGKFRPDKVITRAEFAKIVVLAAGLQPQKAETSSFSDIKVTDWFSPFIETAKKYLTGYTLENGESVYKPDSPASREDAAIAIVKIKGYDVGTFPDRSIIQAMFSDYDSIS